MNTIKEAKLCWNTSTCKIDFKPNGQSLKVTAEDLDFNQSYSDIINCDLNITTEEGKSIFAFNGILLNEAIKYLDEDLNISYSIPTRAFIFDNKILLMPVMANA